MSFCGGEIPFADESDFCAIFAKALFPLLKLNEGIVIHWDGNGYMVHKEFDDDAQEVQVKITQNDDYLTEFKDEQLCWLHDESEVFGNA